MTDYSDFCAELRDWANRQDWSDALVGGYVSSANEKLNAELRIDRMIRTDNGTVISGCAALPDDWLEMRMVRIANADSATGFLPIRYQARDVFYNQSACDASGTYTLEGREIIFGGTPDIVNGTGYKITYYGEVPVFSDTVESWVYDKYHTLYRYAALMHSYMHAVGEEQNAANLKQLVEDMIQKLNDDHKTSRTSGSLLTVARTRSFG